MVIKFSTYWRVKVKRVLQKHGGWYRRRHWTKPWFKEMEFWSLSIIGGSKFICWSYPWSYIISKSELERRRQVTYGKYFLCSNKLCAKQLSLPFLTGFMVISPIHEEHEVPLGYREECGATFSHCTEMASDESKLGWSSTLGFADEHGAGCSYSDVFWVVFCNCSDTF